ncbi:ribonuclease P protein component [Spiroplasma endosymbiont of Agriotes lineatus]|uniref:ribonuclease P protein component n=1 Tax=Spiroplasma endosymbiont of Agriotes lineatus TaxID=3077930 RepID=UPI0030D57AD9
MQKKFRLKKNYDFQRIINEKQKIHNNSFVIYYANNSLDHCRFGISVSKKNANAVNRNRIRRQVRSMLQKVWCLKNNNKDIIILVRSPYLKQEYSKNQNLLDILLKKIIK